MIDLTGKKFGRLTVVDRCGSDNSKNATWNCICDCGKHIVVSSAYLRCGDTRSCGCLKSETVSERMRTHGFSKTRLYKIWAGMKTRCNNPNADNYQYYGGRGIHVCDEWANDFVSFQSWALENGFEEEKPQAQCSLDRIDDDGDYCPKNCRWTTATIQCNNQKSNKKYEFDGEIHSIAEWARIKGIKYSTLKQRLRRGMEFSKAISK